MEVFLAWLEGSALGEFMRAGRWTYALASLSHVFGIACLFGAIATLDLRLMGAWPRLPISILAKPILTVAGFGLAPALFTGVLLLSTQATEYVANPFLYIKFVALGFGIANIVALHFSSAWRTLEQANASDAGRTRLAIGGAVSLLCWIVTISAGRMIAFW